jgi:phosphoglycerate dehydrogenase-like enzyme
MREGRKPYLVNTSRGGLIQDEALLHALDNGHIRGAILDAFSYEGQQNELGTAIRNHHLVTATPHIAGGGSITGLLVICMTAYNVAWTVHGLHRAVSLVSAEMSNS